MSVVRRFVAPKLLGASLIEYEVGKGFVNCGMTRLHRSQYRAGREGS
jgi:hypothetical protein